MTFIKPLYAMKKITLPLLLLTVSIFVVVSPAQSQISNQSDSSTYSLADTVRADQLFTEMKTLIKGAKMGRGRAEGEGGEGDICWGVWGGEFDGGRCVISAWIYSI